MKNYVLIMFLFFSVSLKAFSWGANGHRIIGEISSKYLKGKTKKAIKEILGNESLAISSTWADFTRSDTAMNYLAPWHYINIKEGLNKEEFETYLKKDTTIDAFTKLNVLIDELKNKKNTLEKQKFYLRLLVHIVGDIHQPLHTGRKEDHGGNKINVFWFNQSTNLHALWDDGLIENQKLSYTEYATSINFSNKNQRAIWQNQSMQEWLFESYQLSEKVYLSAVSGEKLGYRYNFDHIESLNAQLLKGGIRLAGLLNFIFR